MTGIMRSIGHPYRRAVSIILFSFVFFDVSAQDIRTPDTTTRAMYRTYMAAVGSAANLYNGSEYTAYYPSAIGTPFWHTAGFQQGMISYEGILYKGIPIAYDLVSNEVLIRDQRQIVIKLDPAKIDFFHVSGHLFVKFNGDTASKNELPPDIYDLLYNGNMRVYVKRKKTVSRNINTEGRFPFMSFNAYFVYKDNAYHNISGRNDLLKLFRDKDDAIRSFWKQNNLNYRSDPEHTIAKTVEYYERLKNQP